MHKIAVFMETLKGAHFGALFCVAGEEKDIHHTAAHTDAMLFLLPEHNNKACIYILETSESP